MKSTYLILFAVSIITACQVQDDNAPAPDESFIKYYGELAGYQARDIEYLYDSSGFIIFGNVDGLDGTTDYTLIRVSLDGTLIDSTVFSFDIPLQFDANENGELDDRLAGNDDAAQVEVFEGGFAVIGTTTLNNSALDILDVQLATFTLFDNQYNNLLDTVFAIPAGNLIDGLDLLGSDIILLSDDSFLLMGSIEVDRGNGSSDLDYFIQKVGGGAPSDNFEEIIGSEFDEVLVRGFEKDNGNIVLIGHTNDPSVLGENNGINGTNVTYTELTSQGKILNSVSYGFDNPNNGTVFDEVVTNAIQTSRGFAITGVSELDTEESYAFFMNLSNDGEFIGGDTLTSSFGNGLESRGYGIVEDQKNNFIVLGEYLNFDITDNTGAEVFRAGESLFMQVDFVGQPIAGSEAHYGTANGNDYAVDGLRLPDGKVIVLANMDFGGGIELMSIIKTDNNGRLQN